MLLGTRTEPKALLPAPTLPGILLGIGLSVPPPSSKSCEIHHFISSGAAIRTPITLVKPTNQPTNENTYKCSHNKHLALGPASAARSVCVKAFLLSYGPQLVLSVPQTSCGQLKLPARLISPPDHLQELA